MTTEDDCLPACLSSCLKKSIIHDKMTNLDIIHDSFMTARQIGKYFDACFSVYWWILGCDATLLGTGTQAKTTRNFTPPFLQTPTKTACYAVAKGQPG